MDKRDKLWDKSFETYYDCYFEEMAAENLVRKWLLLDDVTKVLVAITASGSAVSGWALWNNDEFKLVWIILAGLGAFLSILHASLNVQSRVKEWEELKKLFTVLRIKIETFRHNMEMDPDFCIEAFTNDYDKHRATYSTLMERLRGDIARTKRFEENIQVKLDLKISDQIKE